MVRKKEKKVKKRLIDVNFFYPSELAMYKKHLKHGKYPGEKAYEKAEKKSIRALGKLDTKKEAQQVIQPDNAQ